MRFSEPRSILAQIFDPRNASW